MRRDDSTTPFDAEADDLTQEFWGASRDWVSSEQPSARAPRDTRRRPPTPVSSGVTPVGSRDQTGSMRAIREGFAAFRPQTAPNPTGQIARQRRHGAPARPTRPVAAVDRREATLGELAIGHADVGGWYDEPGADDAWERLGRQPSCDGDHIDRFDEPEIPLTPVAPLAARLGIGAVDPLLLRAGVAIVALVVAVPFMLSLRPDRSESLPGEVVEIPAPVAAGAAPATADPVAAAAVPAVVGATAPVAATDEEQPAAPSPTPDDTVVASPDAASTTDESASSDVTQSGDRVLVESASVGGGVEDAAAVDAAAERVVPGCPQTYTAAPGDSWYRIADAAGISPATLLAENTATTETVILPGDEICLPTDAKMPAPPTTTEPPADETTSTTEPDDDGDDDAPVTTEAPATTAPPSTTASPTTTEAPVANLSRSEVQDLIRQTWPADEVDKALEVARRESNYIATADNGWCCVGVFQIYWTVHRSWLDDFGIHERSDLFDARKNIAAAYHMWQRSGWGPWGG